MREVDRWFRDGGNERYRYTYDLYQDSVVFDVGGYMGNWSEKIFNKYHPTIYIFEPVKKYYELIKSKFLTNDKVKVFNFGLSNKTQTLDIKLSNDGSSVHIKNGDLETINLKSIIDFVNENNIESINLLKLNVEGEEYNIMDSLLESGFADKINDYQIQYHDFIEDCNHRRDKIRENLKNTHKETYCYKFVWENWEKLK